jgi:AsmA family protein
MNASIRRWLIGLAVGFAALIVAAVGLAAGVEAGFFRGTLIALIAARVGRPIEVQGTLEAHVFSRHPRVRAQRVIIGNPPWVAAGRMAEIGELSLQIQTPWFDRSFGIESLTIKSATLHFSRDSSGHANWQWSNPDQAAASTKMAIVRRLSVFDAHVVLDDARRHLQFEGRVSALDSGGSEARALRIEGTGQLNGRAATFEITGDPLAGASHERPYQFSFVERSSGSRLTGRGSLPRPFDVTALEATFDAAGADLQDLYFLTGVKLINTGGYRLSGKFVREGNTFEFSDLSATSGASDVHGSVSIDSSGKRPRLDVHLSSQFLRMADLGERAAGRGAPEASPPLLLSNATLSPAALRMGDATLMYRAGHVEIGRVSLQQVSAKGTIDHGILTVAPLTGDVLGGTVYGRVRLDARTEPPTAAADLRFNNLQLAQIPRKTSGPAPLEGLLQARVAVTGKGSSIHQVAATADGTVTAVVPQGTVRDSFAELTGIDLRGVGLLLAKNQEDTALRCAIVVLKDQEGTLTVQRFVADTDPVLITGDGQIHLDTESLDLVIQGHPKSLRFLRFRSPVLVKGTLAHPSIAFETHQLHIIDPGRAQDADCPALTAAVNSEDAQLHPLGVSH